MVQSVTSERVILQRGGARRGHTDSRRPFPVLALRTLPPDAALRASRPPGPRDFERDLREGLPRPPALIDGESFFSEAESGWKPMDFRERRGLVCCSEDIVSQRPRWAEG